MTEFGKLVRDRIPAIIEAEGRRPVVEVLDDVQFRRALLTKLGEEAAEFSTAHGDGVLDELADVYEVLRALAGHAGVGLDVVAERAAKKVLERGAFRDRLYLVRVEDQGDA